MKLLTSPLTKVFLLVTSLFLASCQSVDVRGQFISDSSIEEVKSKKPSKDELIDVLGTPTYVPEYSPNTWYYIQRSSTKRAWFDPKVTEQRIVKVNFTDKGKFINIELITDMHNENVMVDKNYTKSYGTEQTNIQKFVKNIGRFNKTTDGKKRQKKK